MKKLIIIMLTLTCFWSCSRSSSINPEDKPFDIYLCIGQSNMSGRGLIGTLIDWIKGVFLFDGNTWIQAKNPLNEYSNIRFQDRYQGVGPAYSFSRDMVEYTNSDIGLVVNALGGSTIAQWTPDYSGNKVACFEPTVERLKQALLMGGELKGIIWHQGEADRNTPDYLDKLEVVINAFRSEFGNVPWVAGQVVDIPITHDFNQNLLGLPGQVENTAVVLSDGVTTKPDGHIDTPGQILMGERYALKMMELINE